MAERRDILLKGTGCRAETGEEGGRGIFGEAERWSAKLGDSRAVGECRDGCALRYTYSRITEDGVAFSRLMPIDGDGAVLVGGGAYETAVTILAASLAAVPLTLCSLESSDPRVGEHAEGRGYGLVISFGATPAWIDNGARHIDLSSFSATVMGELTGESRGRVGRGEGFVLSFLTDKGFESYSEETLLFLARAFGDMTCFLRGETVMCDAPPSSPFGVVCGLLPSLLKGCCAVYFDSEESGVEYMHLVSPDRLCCGAKTARRMLETLKRADGGAMALPVIFRAERGADMPWLLLERTAFSVRRRLSAAGLMRLGGRLRYVAVRGECPRDVSRGLADFGVAASSVLSGYGYPFAAIKKSFAKRDLWGLPLGMMADICDVQRGGKGRITLSGKGLRMLSDEPVLRGNLPGRYRIDGWEGLSLVTELRGCVMQKGEIFIEKSLFL